MSGISDALAIHLYESYSETYFAGWLAGIDRESCQHDFRKYLRSEQGREAREAFNPERKAMHFEALDLPIIKSIIAEVAQ